MSKIVENLIENEKKKIALNLLQDGKVSKEEIAEYFGFSDGLWGKNAHKASKINGFSTLG